MAIILVLLTSFNDIFCAGDADLVIMVTWVTMLYENIGTAAGGRPIYVEKSSMASVITSLRFYGVPVLKDLDNDGESSRLAAARLCCGGSGYREENGSIVEAATRSPATFSHNSD